MNTTTNTTTATVTLANVEHRKGTLGWTLIVLSGAGCVHTKLPHGVVNTADEAKAAAAAVGYPGPWRAVSDTAWRHEVAS